MSQVGVFVSLPAMTVGQSTASGGCIVLACFFISQGLWGGFLTVPTTEEGFCVYTTVSDITQLVSGHPGGTGTLPSYLFLSPISLP